MRAEHQALNTLSEAKAQVIKSKAFIRCHHNLKIEAECRGSVNGAAHLPLRSEMIEDRLMSSDGGNWNQVTHLGIHLHSRERENCPVFYSWLSEESPSLNPWVSVRESVNPTVFLLLTTTCAKSSI